MYIRRKVFSVGTDEYGEERLFSVNEVISEESYQRLFADPNLLANESSTRGNVRAGLIGGYGGLIGRAAGNRAATKAARKGASDTEVMNPGKKVAGRVGAAAGGLVGTAAAASGLAYAKKAGFLTPGRVALAGKRIKNAVSKTGLNLSKVSNKKLGMAGLAATAAVPVIAGTLGGKWGARSGAKKAIQERQEQANVTRYGK